MKNIKIIILLSVLFFNINIANAFTNIDKYMDAGDIYTSTVSPITIPVNTADESNSNNIHPVPDKKIDLSKLKRGEASKINILKLVEMGDSGIEKAAKNGNITKIHYVDSKKSKVYIPYFFFPIYAKATTTYVYGE